MFLVGRCREWSIWWSVRLNNIVGVCVCMWMCVGVCGCVMAFFNGAFLGQDAFMLVDVVT